MAGEKARYEQIKRSLISLLRDQADDRRLRDNIEGFTRDDLFSGLSWFWGPMLYERNRVIFRPLILNHFSEWHLTGGLLNRWARVRWADHEDDLEAWLTAARKNRDTRIVRLLLGWKYAGKGWGVDKARWQQALIAEFKNAPTAAARAIVLDEFDTWFTLKEPTAVALYQIDPNAKTFILAHLPNFYWDDENRSMWTELANLARGQGDDEFFFELYRKCMPVDRWAAEIATLGLAVEDPNELCEELSKRHLDGYGLDLLQHVTPLVQKRGRDVIPYLREKHQSLFGGWREKGIKEIVALAKRRGWWDLWSAVVRTQSEQNLYNKAVLEVLDDKSINDDQRDVCLRALAGASREWNWPGVGISISHSLDDEVAVRLYQFDPDLVRGPFLSQVTPRWWHDSSKLLEVVLGAQDNELIDILASRYITKFQWRYYGSKKSDSQLDTAAKLADYYQSIRERDKTTYALRASNVLTRVPAYATYDFGAVLETNKLARLFFVRSFEVFLTSPRAVRDLVEGSSIFCQLLAYRVLAADDDRARALAVENLDILLGTLLRPIHRKTRLPAFDALANAAAADARAAKRILDRARDAMGLPDKRYPKDELTRLIGKILNAHPALCETSETPTIYGLEVSAA